MKSVAVLLQLVKMWSLSTCFTQCSSRISKCRRACGHVDEGTCPHQVLAATLTLSQPGGQIMPTLYTSVHTKFWKPQARLIRERYHGTYCIWYQVIYFLFTHTLQCSKTNVQRKEIQLALVASSAVHFEYSSSLFFVLFIRSLTWSSKLES